MIQKLDLSLSGQSLSAYADDETPIVHALNTPLHKHAYGELHCTLQGATSFTVNGKAIQLSAGEALYIPKGCFHSNRACSAPLEHFVILVESENTAVFRKEFSPERLRSVLAALRKTDGKHFQTEALHAFLFFLADFFFSSTAQSASELPYEEVINRFISRHYPEQLTQKDLAAALHLSATQTGRIMRRVTGKTFLAYLTDYRLDIAEHLCATTSLPLTEIAQRVGYRSYPGFYKARQKRRMEEKCRDKTGKNPHKL